MRTTASLVGLAATVSATVAVAQDRPPTFRAGTDTVAIYATVLNAGGELVPDLQREDFDIFDDGRRQIATQFKSGLQPITATLLLDTSASMALNLQLARTAAEQFVIRMLPGDRARIGTFSDRVNLGPAFTDDRDALLRALAEPHIGNPTKLWDALDDALATSGSIGGRRVVLLLTDGLDTASRASADHVINRARRDEAVVYLVQFRPSRRALAAEWPAAVSLATALAGGSGSTNVTAGSEPAQRLARQSGGSAFLLTSADDVNATFTSLMRELHYQYVLGFTPQHNDGEVHDLRVAVNRPGLTVRARKTYLAAGEWPATPSARLVK